MKRIICLGNLFVWNSSLAISRSMQYRFDFLMGTLINLLFSLMGPLVQYLLFTQTKGFPNWNLDQIILFQGILLFTIGLRSTLFGNSRSQFIRLIRNGEFDRFLLKPFPPIALLLATSFNLDGIGTVCAGVVVTVYSIIKLNLLVTIWQVGLFLLSVILGLLFIVALDIIHCSLIILTVADGGINGILNAYLRFAEYPLEIYSGFMKTLFITFIPITIIVYYPTQIILNRMDIRILYASSGVFIFYGLSLLFWGTVLKKYTSAGG